MTSCTQKLLARGGSFSENLNFLDLRCEKMLNEKKCHTTKHKAYAEEFWTRIEGLIL